MKTFFNIALQKISEGKCLCVLFVLFLLSSCSVTDVPKNMSFDSEQRWVLLPIQNHTGNARAGEQVGTILGAVLRNRGLTKFDVSPDLDASDALPELDEKRRYEQSLEWAKKNGFALGITGSVDEWHYKSGVEGEPAVALVVQVVDVASGRVIWNAVGGRSGWGRETLSGTGQKLLIQLLASLQIRNEAHVARR